MLDFVDKFKSELLGIQNTLNELLGIKTFIDSLKKTAQFFDLFFSIVPFEVILLLIFCALFLVLVNNISPTTPRINITIAVGLFCVISLYINHIFTGEYKFLHVFYISLYVLVPAYSVELSKFAYKQIYNIRQKSMKIENPEELVKSIREINQRYYEFLNAQADFKNNPLDLKKSAANLKSSIEQLEKRI
ncbi:MAG TPA: hypothetical protein PK079_03175 [Leptospiraceae bacterium]|nr:hypothetical protein [Leptospiraceae bacterium]HMW03755.1 hypothetical protein [Leptospiraceae bacterium]HMX31868.1 hypothetical protein [Leptospiraceae bacterium]HMY29735.1 hypothetical protein [Leptospiraceae bacterium]HMZ62866.1 hypothetical protein [Leptospiraceae bacterium]